MSARPALNSKPRRGNAYRASHHVSENLELFKVSILAPNSSGSGSPPPSSRTAHKEGPKRNPPLVPDIALSDAVKAHWTQEGYEGPLGIRGQTVFRPSAYVELQPLGLTGGEEKSFRLHIASPRQGSAQVCKSFSKPVAYPDPVARTLDADLSTDHRPSATPE